MRCDDIDTLAQAFLDDELAETELHDFQVHIADCPGCKDKVQAERAFLDDLRRQLTATTPRTPDLVRKRIVGALDQEDATVAAKLTRTRRSWLLPGASIAAAAAALVLFVVAQQPARTAEPIATDAARQHLRKPPVEVQGARVSPWLAENFLPDVPVPRLGDGDPVGARLSHLMGRDAALIYYRVVIDGRSHEVQAHILDASGIDLDIGSKAVVAGRSLWVGDSRGVSVVSYRAGRNLGYVFTSSDMRPHELVDVVANSDLLQRVDERLKTR